MPRPIDDTTEPGGAGLLAQLRRHWLIVLVATAVTAAAAYAISDSRPKTYTASTPILVQSASAQSEILGTGLPQDSVTQIRSTSTIAALTRSRSVAESASRALDGRLTPTQVRDRIVAAPNPDANIVNIQAKDDSPEHAAELANTFARVFIRNRARDVRDQAEAAQKALQRRYRDLSSTQRKAAAGQSLNDQIQRLTTLRSLGSRGLSVVEQAEPPA